MPILGIVASGANVSSTAFESIATATPSGGIDTYTFSSIPGTYQHLQLRIFTKATSNTYSRIFMRLNSNTGNNYSRNAIGVSGGTTAAGAGTFQSSFIFSQIGEMTLGSFGTDIFGVGIIDIYDYANTSKNTSIRAISGVDTNDSGSPGGFSFDAGVFTNTAAITSITLFMDSVNYDNDTKLALYGIKAA